MKARRRAKVHVKPPQGRVAYFLDQKHDFSGGNRITEVILQSRVALARTVRIGELRSVLRGAGWRS